MPGTGEASVVQKWPRRETLVLSKGGAFRKVDLDSVLNFTTWTSKSSSLQQVTISSTLSTGDKGPFSLLVLIVRFKINFIKHLMFGLEHSKCSVNHAYINRSCLTLQLRMISCPQLHPPVSGKTMIPKVKEKCFWRKFWGQQQHQTIALTRKSVSSPKNTKILSQKSYRGNNFQDRRL